MNTRAELTPQFLIIGAGPAGLISGIQLLRLGYTVTIIERNTQQNRPVCGEYLSPEGCELLKEMNLESTFQGFQEVRGMTLFSPAGRMIETNFPNAKSGRSLNRKIFQERLATIFGEMNGKILYGQETLNMTHAKVETTDCIFMPEWIIGADGRQSTVARMLGLRSRPPESKRVAVHCYLRPKVPIGPYGQMHVLPDGSYIGINPINDDEVNFSIVTDARIIERAGGPREIINSWISTRAHLAEQFNPINKEALKTTFPVSRTSLDIVKDNVALIGDASGFIDPLTGEGITTAIKSAHLLSQLIKEASSVEKAFLQYAISRKKNFSGKEKLNIGFQRVIRSRLASESLAMTLNLSTRLRDTFIGVVGNIYTPSEAIKAYLTERF